MIPSTDTYLKAQIEAGLEFFLHPDNTEFLNEVLSQMNRESRRRFIKAYARADSREVPVLFRMPSEPVSLEASIFIGLRQGQETSPSIGNLEGTFSYITGEEKWEPEIVPVHVTDEGDRYYFELSEHIGELTAIEELTISHKHDKPAIDGPRFYFGDGKSLSGMEGQELTVHYIPFSDEGAGFVQGFTADESYSVTAISYNMDNVRALDLIIKSILITMRSNAQEQLYYNLQNISFGQPEPVNASEILGDNSPELIYGRESIVSYTVSYGLHSKPLKQLSEILMKTREVELDG